MESLFNIFIVNQIILALNKFCIVKAPIKELDLLIRTGGDHRISNFLLYHLAYTEIQFLDTLWPDFNEENFESLGVIVGTGGAGFDFSEQQFEIYFSGKKK